jgi:hypothetical protein
MSLKAQPNVVIERIFQTLVGLYGASFTRQWHGVDPESMKHTWARELAGFTLDELTRGLEACRTREFPPTVPEFRNLCRPVADVEAAFFEAARLWPSRIGWSRPEVYWAAMAIGDDVKKQPYHTMRGRWREAYQRALDAPKALPDPTPAPMLEDRSVSPEEREAAYQRVRASWEAMRCR